jgi:hypothetical protein
MQNYTEITKCRACGSDDLRLVLDLNDQPLANSFTKDKDEELPYFPLKLNLCDKCYHLQLSVKVNPDLLFKNYLYVSGTSQSLHNYFYNFAYDCNEFCIDTDRSVLDIACNDGTQLDKFKEMGWKTYGVDPAENLYSISSQNHHIVCDFWNESIASDLLSKTKHFNLITAQNVFAHTDDISSFLKACSLVMNEKSTLLIQTSQADMISNNEFDTIYHEHLSFFNSRSMKECLNREGFSLVEVRKTPIHGNSYVFVIKKGKCDEELALEEMKREEDQGLYSTETYLKYADRCLEITSQLKDLLGEYKNQGKKLVGYGAAAKGNTLLNFSQLSLDYIVDDNPLKWNTYSPGSQTPVKEPTVLKEENAENIIVIPLAWNFFDEIKNKTENIIEGPVKYVRYFPVVETL